MPAPTRNTGFTLVELLVVIGIISILAAMLLPSLENAVTHARVIRCLAQQKQIATGCLLYANDHSDYVPVNYNYYQDGTLRAQTSAPSNGWYMIPWDGHGIGFKAGYLWPQYITDGHLFHCPDIESINASGEDVTYTYDFRYGNSGGWKYATGSPPMNVKSTYYFLGVDDPVTAQLAQSPGGFRNNYNQWKGRMLLPRVAQNMHKPMLWDMGHLASQQQAWTKAHAWTVCNVAYWDGSATAVDGVELFLQTHYASLAGTLSHRDWYDIITHE